MLLGQVRTYEPRYEKTDFLHMRKKDADQLRSNCAADQRLCFRYMDSTIPLLSKSEISSLQPSSVVKPITIPVPAISEISSCYIYSVVVQPGLCRPICFI